MDFLDLDITVRTKNEKPALIKEQSNNLKKKLKNSMAALTKSENKTWDELIQNEPSLNLFAFHFGVGSEDDYQTLKNYLKQFGKCKLQIFPSKNYAFVEFEDFNQVQSLMNTMSLSKENVSYIPLIYDNHERPSLFFYSRLNQNQIAQSFTSTIPDAREFVNIPGMTLIKNFITEEEEQSIIEQLEQQEWTKLNQRRVQHYGFDFIYGANTVSADSPASKTIPPFLDQVCSKVNVLFEGKQDPVDQLTVNEYLPGMGIPPHFDVHPPFQGMFVSISLGSGLVMSFKSYKGEQQHLLLPARSCVLFAGEARHVWTHTIAARKIDKVNGEMLFRRKRVSLTLRTIRKDYKCQCEWPFYCESQGYDPLTMKTENPLLRDYLHKHNQTLVNDSESSSRIVPNKSQEETKMMQQVEGLDQNTPTDIEKKYVYEIYEKIAPHFSSTRYKPWPQIEDFLNSLEVGSFVADVGCGNGKYLHVNRENIHMVGTDRSENLISICRERDQQYQVFTADSLRLPLRTGSFDAVISIAVIHHFSNKYLRQAAISELQRITRIGGKIIIYVWAFEQEEKQFSEQDVFVPWNLQFKYEDKSKLEQPEEEKKDDLQTGVNDYQINESKQTVVYKRYYHVFKKGEIEELIEEMVGLNIETSYYDHANWVVILRKTG